MAVKSTYKAPAPKPAPKVSAPKPSAYKVTASKTVPKATAPKPVPKPAPAPKAPSNPVSNIVKGISNTVSNITKNPVATAINFATGSNIGTAATKLANGYNQPANKPQTYKPTVSYNPTKPVVKTPVASKPAVNKAPGARPSIAPSISNPPSIPSPPQISNNSDNIYNSNTATDFENRFENTEEPQYSDNTNYEDNRGYKYTPPDYTPQIKQKFADLLAGSLAKLRTNTANQLSQYTGQEDIARQTGIQALNANDVEKMKALASLRNSLEASGGYGGGENVTGTAQINTMAQNNANVINQDVNNRLNQLQALRDTIQKNAADNELALQTDIGTQEADALLNQAQYADERAYQVDKNTQDRLDKLTELKQQNDQWQKQYDLDKSWKDFDMRMKEQDALWQQSPENPEYQGKILDNKAKLLANAMANEELYLYNINAPQEQKLKVQMLKQQLANLAMQPKLTQLDIDKQNAEIDKINQEVYNMKNGRTASGGATVTQTQQNNQDFADDYKSLKNMSVSNAMNAMNSKWSDMIAKYGASGANKLWNTVLADAIEVGQAMAK